MIGGFLAIAAARREEPALANARCTWSFAELSDRVRAYGEGLSRSQKRPVIYAALRGGPDQVALFLACLSVSAIHVPLAEDIAPDELATCAELLPPDAILFDEGGDLSALRRKYRGALPPGCRMILAGMRAPTGLAEVRGCGQVASLPQNVRHAQFWHGPDGAKRALLFTEASLLADHRQSASYLRAYEGRRLFCALSPSHPATCSVVFGHLLRGSGVVFGGRGGPASTLAELRASQARGVLGTASWMRDAVHEAGFCSAELPCLEELCLALGPAPAELVARLSARFSRGSVHVRHGIAESFGALLRHDIRCSTTNSRPGLLGYPVRGIGVSSLPALGSAEFGELRVKAPSLAIAYTEHRGEWELLADEAGFFGWGEKAQRDPDGGIVVEQDQGKAVQSAPA